MAAALARNGAKVYIASRKLPELQRVAESLSQLSPTGAVEGPAVVPLQADVSSKAGCDALANEIKAREKTLNILINNSGVTWGAVIDDFPETKGWDRTFDLNVKAQFYLTVASVLSTTCEGRRLTSHQTPAAAGIEQVQHQYVFDPETRQ